MKKPLIVICTALLLLTACGGSHVAPSNSSQPTPASSAAATPSAHYQGVGVVKSVNTKQPAIEIDHEEIVGLMPAMQMEFPVTDPNQLNGIAVNDRIDFTIDNATGEMKIITIKKK